MDFFKLKDSSFDEKDDLENFKIVKEYIQYIIQFLSIPTNYFTPFSLKERAILVKYLGKDIVRNLTSKIEAHNETVANAWFNNIKFQKIKAKNFIFNTEDSKISLIENFKINNKRKLLLSEDNKDEFWRELFYRSLEKDYTEGNHYNNLTRIVAYAIKANIPDEVIIDNMNCNNTRTKEVLKCIEYWKNKIH